MLMRDDDEKHRAAVAAIQLSLMRSIQSMADLDISGHHLDELARDAVALEHKIVEASLQ